MRVGGERRRMVGRRERGRKGEMERGREGVRKREKRERGEGWDRESERTRLCMHILVRVPSSHFP